MDLDALLSEPLDWRHRWTPPGTAVPAEEAAKQGWRLLGGDLLLPVMAVKESALEHNLSLMAAFCRERGLSLAPHGKTTMAPQIWRRQLEQGAWALTVATAGQARVARRFGVRRLLIANQLLDPRALRWVAAELASSGDVEIFCLADSTAGVEAMDEALASAPPPRRLPVLVEAGYPGGRAGCRSPAEGVLVARALARARHLEPAGVELFEGLVRGGTLEDRLRAADAACQRLAEMALALAREGVWGDRDEIVVSAGGSAFFDIAARTLAAIDLGGPVRRVLRSGCYVVHDHLLYEAASPLGSRLPGDAFRPALELWAAVLSRPEPGLAIAGFGRRDAPHDAGLPLPLAVHRRGMSRPAAGLEVAALDDQHAHLRLGAGADLEPGDLVSFGISHPCTAFDKWRSMPLVDDGLRVTGAVLTYF